MINIKRYHLHVVHLKEGTEGYTRPIIDRDKVIKIKPADNENMLRMKEQIAEKVEREAATGKWTYWYLVVEIEREDGESAFRPAIKKTFFRQGKVYEVTESISRNPRRKS